MAESYVRPPLVAAEVRSATVARWRFRAVAALLLVVLAGLVVLAFLRFSGVASEDPGFTGGLQAPVGVESSTAWPGASLSS